MERVVNYRNRRRCRRWAVEVWNESQANIFSSLTTTATRLLNHLRRSTRVEKHQEKRIQTASLCNVCFVLARFCDICFVLTCLYLLSV